MTDRLVVRAARLDDLAEIVELRLALLREYGDAPLYARLRPDVDERARELYFAQLVAPHETMLLAERRGQIVGILRCVDTTASPLLLPERYCYVSSVYVRPAERRRGVLRALVAAAEKWCAERGIGEMRLHNSASSSFIGQVWEAFGFEVVEHVRRRVLPIGRDALGSPPHSHAAHAREEKAR
ncbi:MAG TPA: GNAT family N-acetyltransferase [Gemmatimonadaceae bacterium]